jgi:DNA processing protein
MASRERAALVALLRTRPDRLSWPEITAEVMEAGSAVEVWDRHVPRPLVDLPGEVTPTAEAAREIEQWAARDCRLISILDSDYPARLRGVHQAPPVLFTRGAVVVDDPAVAVVGSRSASDQGLRFAAGVARGLAARQMTVASGLARGIDTAAHRAALDAGGRTVAVIATGIARTYPPENEPLQRDIAARGMVLSQFWPDAPPQKQSFLMRNATMSGYGLATVVVEAGEHSGARSQARMAVEHGRQVILTDHVVAHNRWAQDMLGRPGVHMTSSVNGVLDAVDQIVAMWDEIRRLVAP